MINFRFHIASLIAMFLALALGVVMGSTVIDRAIVDGLRDRSTRSKTTSNAGSGPRTTQLERAARPAEPCTPTQSAAYAVRQPAAPTRRVAIVAERGVDEEAVRGADRPAAQRGRHGAGHPLARERVEPHRRRHERRTRCAARSGARPARPTRRCARRRSRRCRARLAQGAAVPAEPRCPRLAGQGRLRDARGRRRRRRQRRRPSRAPASRALLLGGPESDIAARTTMAEMAQALVAASTLTAVGELDPENLRQPGRCGSHRSATTSELSAVVSTIDDVDLVEGPRRQRRWRSPTSPAASSGATGSGPAPRARSRCSRPRRLTRRRRIRAFATPPGQTEPAWASSSDGSSGSSRCASCCSRATTCCARRCSPG